MAADYIPFKKPGRSTLATQTISAANQLKELRERIAGLMAIGSHQFDGADYTVLEAQFTLQNAGQGDDLLALLTLMHNILNTTTDVTGANRISQMDEFVARLAGQ